MVNNIDMCFETNIFFLVDSFRESESKTKSRTLIVPPLWRERRVSLELKRVKIIRIYDLFDKGVLKLVLFLNET
jgi:hypothetical protein